MPGKRWTEADIESLREQLDQGLALKEVTIDGRTVNAIRSQALRMELVEMRANRRKWPSRQRRLLRKCKEQGLTPIEIFEFGLLGDPLRSFWAIRKQWGRMKLSDRRRARQMRKKKIWKPGEKKKFDTFLRKNSKLMTPEEIGKEWGVARSTVARRQTELGVKATREQVMAMDYSLAKQKRARQRIRRNSINMWAKRRSNRESDLINMAEEIRDSARPPTSVRAATVAAPGPNAANSSTPAKRKSASASAATSSTAVCSAKTSDGVATNRKRRSGKRADGERARNQRSRVREHVVELDAPFILIAAIL